jgi:hypothetical protein
MNWTPARTAFYLTCLLGFIGAAMSALGFATYDAQAGTIDIHPIHISTVVGLVAPAAAATLATFANLLKWGKR